MVHSASRSFEVNVGELENLRVSAIQDADELGFKATAKSRANIFNGCDQSSTTLRNLLKTFTFSRCAKGCFSLLRESSLGLAALVVFYITIY